MSLSATSGTLAAGASTTVSVSINPYADSLTAGDYSDIISIVNSTTGTGNSTRAVALTVNAPGQLEVSPAEGLDSSGYVGNLFDPSSITYTLVNSGDTTLDWTARQTADWLDLSTASGTLARALPPRSRFRSTPTRTVSRSALTVTPLRWPRT